MSSDDTLQPTDASHPAATPDAAAPADAAPLPIDAAVRANLGIYFRDLEGMEPNGLYDMVIKAVERPLLEVVLAQAEGNQSRAAEWLGINRNTLRRKLLEHKLAE
ncbi:hypothetical protein CATMQ487_12100 [Sphaerotilus microaerophilus]|uniref:DNA binding HTH domain-containing protein n=1 Tax=Sphaerotilus microaerophilus TaxID=2914710 RepID=A0ABM7YIM6_9BURK|nr:hypothetical protein CATMQ487_12100 [Sphaerotilus sp. FB-5]